jgi:hypothetical protein
MENKIEETTHEVTKPEQDIVITDPEVFRPKELPLVIQLPADASKAQVEFAKVLNAYAYKNPTKWREKKEDKMVNGKVVKGLISQLRDMKNAPDPIVNDNLTFKNKLLE